MRGRVLRGLGTHFRAERERPEWAAALADALVDVSLDVAYLHQCVGFETDAAFGHLLRFLRTSTVWAVNLGELNFSSVQLDALTDALRASHVTHMFYECDHLPSGMKESWRGILRCNREKHSRWLLSDADKEGQVSILECTNMWFDPVRHARNQRLLGRVIAQGDSDSRMH